MMNPGISSEINAFSPVRALALARVAWFVMLVLCLLLFVISLPEAYAFYLTVCHDPSCAQNLQLSPEQARELRQLGFSIEGYALYFIALTLLSSLVYVSVAVIIFWRKSYERMALICAFMLIGWGLGGQLSTNAVPVGLIWLTQLIQALGNLSIVLFFFLFPDGRFVPRWTRWFALLAVLREVLAVYFPSNLFNALFFVSVPLILLLQLYRYRRVSNAVQRQQTKWVVFGTTVALIGFPAVLIIYDYLSSAGTTPSVLVQILGGTAIDLFLLLIPISIGFAILRARLWDIDILIRRTLAYGALTALLALVYLGSVVTLQQAFRQLTGQGSDVAVVISTLAIAALFLPLRSRVQRAIDRRFYRHKYDAQKILTEFGATVRDQVDLSSLTDELLAVVEETMQPTRMSLWLRVTPGGGREVQVAPLPMHQVSGHLSSVVRPQSSVQEREGRG